MLAGADLLLRAAELHCGSVLGVALHLVGELGRATDQVQCVHPHRVGGRLDPGGAARGLENA